MRRHTLLIDADDTLWENNVFFEKLIEDFIGLVESCGYTRAYVRHILNETERKNIRQYGYGVRSFGRSLEETYLKLAEQMVRRETLAQIHDRVVELDVFMVDDYCGEPAGLEAQALKWVAAAELGGQALLPADQPIVEVLNSHR